MITVAAQFWTSMPPPASFLIVVLILVGIKQEIRTSLPSYAKAGVGQGKQNCWEIIGRFEVAIVCGMR